MGIKLGYDHRWWIRTGDYPGNIWDCWITTFPDFVDYLYVPIVYRWSEADAIVNICTSSLVPKGVGLISSIFLLPH